MPPFEVRDEPVTPTPVAQEATEEDQPAPEKPAEDTPEEEPAEDAGEEAPEEDAEEEAPA